MRTDTRTRIKARELRIGDLLLTADGWQRINGVVVFEDADQVTVHTPQRDDLSTDGWRMSLNQRVVVRTPDRQRPRTTRRALVTAPRATACPSWCVEHYTAADGTVNHSGAPLSAVAEATIDGDPREVSVWIEQRNLPNGTVERVGVVDTLPGAAELCACSVQRLIEHLTGIAAQIREARS